MLNNGRHYETSYPMPADYKLRDTNVATLSGHSVED